MSSSFFSFFSFFLEIVDVNFASFQGAFQYKVKNTLAEFCYFMLVLGNRVLQFAAVVAKY